MKTVTFFQCDTCSNMYTNEQAAIDCEASKPTCDFAVGDRVYLINSVYGFARSSGRTLEVREVKLRGSVTANHGGTASGHCIDIKLGLVDDNSCPVWTSPTWLEKAQ